MPIFFKYFWFLAAAVMLVNVLIFRRRFTEIVSRGIATQDEADQFVRWCLSFMVGGPLLIGGIALAAGWDSPFCALGESFETVPQTLVTLIWMVGSLAILLWVWQGSGAEFLARVGPALQQKPDYETKGSPQIVRAIVTLLVLASIVGSAVAARQASVNAALLCNQTRVAQ